MARRKCEFKEGRRCLLTDCPATSKDCAECSDYRDPGEPTETVQSHISKMTSREAAELICNAVEGMHGWPDRVEMWLLSEWKDAEQV